MSRPILGKLPIVLVIGLSGCATSPEYQKFAKAGVDYATTLPLVFSLGCKAQVDSSSLGLIMDRADSGSGRISENSLDKQDELDKERCDILKKLSEHAKLLGKYFAALSALSSSEAGAEVAEEIDKAFGQVQAIGQALRGTPLFSGTPALGGMAELAINQRISAALSNELSRRQKTLQEEFFTQEILLKKLGKQIQSAQAGVMNRKRQLYVQEPLLDGSQLYPELLMEARRQQITGRADFGGLVAASEAAKKARETFNDLISGNVDSETMIARIDALIARIYGLRAAVMSFNSL